MLTSKFGLSHSRAHTQGLINKQRLQACILRNLHPPCHTHRFLNKISTNANGDNQSDLEKTPAQLAPTDVLAQQQRQAASEISLSNLMDEVTQGQFWKQVRQTTEWFSNVVQCPLWRPWAPKPVTHFHLCTLQCKVRFPVIKWTPNHLLQVSF